MKTTKLIATAVLLFLALSTFALPGPPPGGPGEETSGPIDSGVIFLLVAVAGYGYMQLKNKEVEEGTANL